MRHDNDESAPQTEQQRIILQKAEEKRLRRGLMRVERSVLKEDGITEEKEFQRAAKVYLAVLGKYVGIQDMSWIQNFTHQSVSK